ncbi:MAG: hypothetical protein FWD71_14140 [Oscillospiraceae bacterium]|nr:hypothetical protein [Oscillospiraceae bacterium]
MKILKFIAFMLSFITFVHVVRDIIPICTRTRKCFSKDDIHKVVKDCCLFAISTIVCVLLHRKSGKDSMEEICNKK